MRKRILVVDDEKDLVELLAYNLKKAGYDVATATTGRAALEAVTTSPPDLIILDIMLPELSGTEVASRIRTNPATAHLPILMLTAKTEEVDQLVGLAVGADDYVTKPFSVKLVLARVEAILRRAGAPSTAGNTINLGDLEIDVETHKVSLSGQPLRLTLTEFRLLAALVQAKGRVLSRQVLMGKAMGPGVTVTERTIDVHVTSIRKKLGDQAWLLKTVRGVGYRASTEREPGDVTAEA